MTQMLSKMDAMQGKIDQLEGEKQEPTPEDNKELSVRMSMLEQVMASGMSGVNVPITGSGTVKQVKKGDVIAYDTSLVTRDKRMPIIGGWRLADTDEKTSPVVTTIARSLKDFTYETSGGKPRHSVSHTTLRKFFKKGGDTEVVQPDQRFVR